MGYAVFIASIIFSICTIMLLIECVCTKKSYKRNLNMIKEKLSFEFSEVRLKNPDECTFVTCIPNKDIEVIAKLDEDNNIIFQFQVDAEIITGKDYLRFAKNQQEALCIFQNKLNDPHSRIIYVLSEKQHLQLVPDHAYRILMSADLDLICKRFSNRMNGKLSDPVKSMLKSKHNCFENEAYDVRIYNSEIDVKHLIELIKKSM